MLLQINILQNIFMWNNFENIIHIFLNWCHIWFHSKIKNDTQHCCIYDNNIHVYQINTDSQTYLKLYTLWACSWNYLHMTRRLECIQRNVWKSIATDCTQNLIPYIGMNAKYPRWRNASKNKHIFHDTHDKYCFFLILYTCFKD